MVIPLSDQAYEYYMLWSNHLQVVDAMAIPLFNLTTLIFVLALVPGVTAPSNHKVALCLYGIA